MELPGNPVRVGLATLCWCLAQGAPRDRVPLNVVGCQSRCSTPITLAFEKLRESFGTSGSLRGYIT